MTGFAMNAYESPYKGSLPTEQKEIVNSVMPQSFVLEKHFLLKEHVLSWTHYHVLSMMEKYRR